MRSSAVGDRAGRSSGCATGGDGSGRVDGAGAAGGGGSGSGGLVAGGGAGVTGALTCGFAVSCGASTVGAGTVGDVDGGGIDGGDAGGVAGAAWGAGGVDRCIAASLFAVVSACDRDRWLRRTATSPRTAALPCTGSCASWSTRVATRNAAGASRVAPAASADARASTCGFALRRRRGCARERFACSVIRLASAFPDQARGRRPPPSRPPQSRPPRDAPGLSEARPGPVDRASGVTNLPRLCLIGSGDQNGFGELLRGRVVLRLERRACLPQRSDRRATGASGTAAVAGGGWGAGRRWRDPHPHDHDRQCRPPQSSR